MSALNRFFGLPGLGLLVKPDRLVCHLGLHELVGQQVPVDDEFQLPAGGLAMIAGNANDEVLKNV